MGEAIGVPSRKGIIMLNIGETFADVEGHRCLAVPLRLRDLEAAYVEDLEAPYVEDLEAPYVEDVAGEEGGRMNTYDSRWVRGLARIIGHSADMLASVGLSLTEAERRRLDAARADLARIVVDLEALAMPAEAGQ